MYILYAIPRWIIKPNLKSTIFSNCFRQFLENALKTPTEPENYDVDLIETRWILLNTKIFVLIWRKNYNCFKFCEITSVLLLPFDYWKQLANSPKKLWLAAALKLITSRTLSLTIACVLLRVLVFFLLGWNPLLIVIHRIDQQVTENEPANEHVKIWNYFYFFTSKD